MNINKYLQVTGISANAFADKIGEDSQKVYYWIKRDANVEIEPAGGMTITLTKEVYSGPAVMGID